MQEYTAVLDSHEAGYCYSAIWLQEHLRSHGYKDAAVTETSVKTGEPIRKETIEFLFNSRSISLLPTNQQ